jgi:hypothetical protein
MGLSAGNLYPNDRSARRVDPVDADRPVINKPSCPPGQYQTPLATGELLFRLVYHSFTPAFCLVILQDLL